MTIPQFEEWSRQAVEWRIQTKMGTLAQAEHERLLKIRESRRANH